jgi:hypothetical protein
MEVLINGAKVGKKGGLCGWPLRLARYLFAKTGLVQIT